MSEDTRFKESFYFGLDLGPIVATWILGMVLIFFLVVVPCCAHICEYCKCCERYADEHCDKCRCGSCGRIKCEEGCGCDRSGCHDTPGCEDCKSSLNKTGSADCNCFHTCKQARKPRILNKNRILRAGNILVRVFYGGDLGPLREEKRMHNTDRCGRDVMYIDDVPIVDKAFFLHLALTLKSILLTVFCLSTFLDLLLVSSDYSCDTSKHCYPLDSFYDDSPIDNCSDVLKSSNGTVLVVCYELVFDYRKAASYAGGLYTISRLTVSIIANVCIWIYKKVKNKKDGWTCFFVAVQYFLGGLFISVCVSIEYANLYSIQKPGPPLTQASNWLDFSCVVLMVALSFLTPWHLAVKPEGVMTRLCRALEHVKRWSCSCMSQTPSRGKFLPLNDSSHQRDVEEQDD